MAKIIQSSPRHEKAPAMTGVSYALAFSTLLSSQETGAHHSPAIRGTSGATLSLYSQAYLAVNSGFRIVSGPHQPLRSRSPPRVPKVRGTHASA